MLWSITEDSAVRARYAREGSAIHIDLNRTADAVVLRAMKLGVRFIRSRYTHNEQAFHAPTPKAAYWAGFLAADGCIQRKNTLAVNLCPEDRDQLERLRDFLRHTGPIDTFPKYVGLRVHGASNLVSDLAAWGVTPRKSLTLRFPDIPTEITPHFIRGYWDGDGCLTVSPGGYPVWQMLGTEEFLQVARECLLALGAPKLSPVKLAKKEGRIYEIRVAGTGAEALIALLPEGLPRKNASSVYQKWLSRGRRTHLTLTAGYGG